MLGAGSLGVSLPKVVRCASPLGGVTENVVRWPTRLLGALCYPLQLHEFLPAPGRADLRACARVRALDAGRIGRTRSCIGAKERACTRCPRSGGRPHRRWGGARR